MTWHGSSPGQPEQVERGRGAAMGMWGSWASVCGNECNDENLPPACGQNAWLPVQAAACDLSVIYTLVVYNGHHHAIHHHSCILNIPMYLKWVIIYSYVVCLIAVWHCIISPSLGIDLFLSKRLRHVLCFLSFLVREQRRYCQAVDDFIAMVAIDTHIIPHPYKSTYTWPGVYGRPFECVRAD